MRNAAIHPGLYRSSSSAWQRCLVPQHIAGIALEPEPGSPDAMRFCVAVKIKCSEVVMSISNLKPIPQAPSLLNILF